MLRLVALKHSDFSIETLYDVIQIGMTARYDDGDEVLHALIYHHLGLEAPSYRFHLEEGIRLGTFYLLFHFCQLDIHASAPFFLVLTVSPEGIDERSRLGGEL